MSSDPRRTRVAVDERMGIGEPVNVDRCQVREVWTAVRRGMRGTSEGRVDRAFAFRPRLLARRVDDQGWWGRQSFESNTTVRDPRNSRRQCQWYLAVVMHDLLGELPQTREFGVARGHPVAADRRLGQS